MASPLEWALKIVDKMSSPAKAAASALKQVTAAAKAADAATSKPLKLNISTRVRQEVTKAKADFKQFGSDVADTFGGVEMIAGAAIAGIYAGAGILAAKGAKMAIDAVTFRENTTIAFKALLGSQKAAEGLYEKVLDVADRVGLEKDQAVASVKKLLSAGFDQAGAIAVLEAMANTAAVLGEGAASKLENFFTILQSTGKADLESLKKTGINIENVYARLAKTMGKTVDQVKALEKAGKLDKAAVTKAVTDEVNKGDIGEALGNSLDRLFGDLSGKFQRLFDKVDISPLRNALKTVLTALDGPAGAKLRDGINKIFGGLFDALFGALDSKRIESILGVVGDALSVVGDIIKAAAPAVKEFVGGFIDGFGEAWPAIRAVGSAIASALGIVGGAGGFFRMMGKGIAYVVVVGAAVVAVLAAIVSAVVYLGVVIVGAFAAAVGLLGSAISAIGSFLSNVGGQIWEFFGLLLASVVALPIMLIDGAIAAGQSIIDGIVAGVTGGAGALYAALVNLAKSAIAAFMSAIGAGSPADEFMPSGSFINMGVAKGVENDNSAQEAVDTMVTPPRGLSSDVVDGAASASSGRGGGGGRSGPLIGHLEIHGMKDGDDVKAKIEEVLEEHWEKLQQAVGA